MVIPNLRGQSLATWLNLNQSDTRQASIVLPTRLLLAKKQYTYSNFRVRRIVTSLCKHRPGKKMPSWEVILFDMIYRYELEERQSDATTSVTVRRESIDRSFRFHKLMKVIHVLEARMSCGSSDAFAVSAHDNIDNLAAKLSRLTISRSRCLCSLCA